MKQALAFGFCYLCAVACFAVWESGVKVQTEAEARAANNAWHHGLMNFTVKDPSGNALAGSPKGLEHGDLLILRQDHGFMLISDS